MIAVQLFGGFLLLFFGGELLIRGAVALSKKLNVSTFIIGLIVVGFGTSSPELFVSVQATITNHPDIALGNIIGSIIFNILAILGLAALICPISMDKESTSFNAHILLYITIIFYLMCWSYNALNRLEGIILLIFLAGYIGITIYKSRNKEIPTPHLHKIESKLPMPLNIWQSILICLAGLGLLTYGSTILITGAVGTAHYMGMSEAVMGITLVAFGTSLPELTIAIMAACRKQANLIVGNIIGSTIFNITGALGIASIIRDIRVAESFVTIDLAVSIATAVILFAVIRKIGKLHRVTGGLFIVGYIGYVAYQLHL